jgi:hypothetical protein
MVKTVLQCASCVCFSPLSGKILCRTLFGVIAAFGIFAQPCRYFTESTVENSSSVFYLVHTPIRWAI